MDSDWWVNVALDGVVGGLIGGLMTGLAVWLTLRHEARRAREAAVEATAARAQTLTLEFVHRLEDRVTGEMRDLYLQLAAASLELVVRSSRDWPALSKEVFEAGEHLRVAVQSSSPFGVLDPLSREEAVAAASQIGGRATDFFFHRDRFKRVAWWRRLGR